MNPERWRQIEKLYHSAAEQSPISPDGRHIAFVAQNVSGTSGIWLRALETQTIEPLKGTEDATGPFWSPDGQFVGFFAQGKLKKIAVAGGPPQNICSTTPGLGASWSPSGVIIFNPTNRAPLMRVSASSGTRAPLTELDTARQEDSHRFPSFLPDGKHFLFTARSSLKENTAIYIGSLDSEETKRLLTEQSNAMYAPPGYVLFVRDRTLMAQQFNLSKLELRGDAFPVAAGVDQGTPSAFGYFLSRRMAACSLIRNRQHSTRAASRGLIAAVPIWDLMAPIAQPRWPKSRLTANNWRLSSMIRRAETATFGL